MKRNLQLIGLVGLVLLVMTWSQPNAGAQVNAPDPMPVVLSPPDQQAGLVIPSSPPALLASGMPYGWSSDLGRSHPASPSSLFTQSSLTDAFVWEAHPQSNYGRDDDLYVADNANSLLQWNLSALPSMAMVDYSELKIRLKQTTGVPTVTISVHPVTSAWDEDHVTWIGRTTTDTWSAPGGDYEAASSWQTLYNATNAVYSWTVTDLVSEWHSGYTANHGVLLRGQSGPLGSFNKIFGSKEDSGYKPTLNISYTLGPVSLSVASPITRGVPSPDWYRFQAGSYWNAVAIRPSSVDYGLALYDTETYANLLVSSTHTSGQVGYVLVDGNHAPAQTYYPQVTQRSGRGNYQIERGFSFGNLGLGPNGPYTMRPEDLIQAWDVELTGGTTYYFGVQPTTGNADLNVRLHKSTLGSSTIWYQEQGNAVASAGGAGEGGAEYFTYTALVNDWYGFLVINNGADSNTSYMIYMDTTPPAGSLKINDGSPYANSISVTLYLSAADSESGILDMRLGNTIPFTTGHTNIPFMTTVPWTLFPSDGTGTVYGQFRSKAGAWSPVYSATVTLNYEVSRIYLPLVLKPLDSPVLYPTTNPERDSYSVCWSAVESSTSYVLQESRGESCFTDTKVYTVPTTCYTVTGKAAGRYSYQVKARNSSEESGWSNMEEVDVLQEQEPDDDWHNPTNGPIAPGLTYSGTFSETGNLKDYFYFELPSEHSVEISLTNILVGSKYVLVLRFPDSRPVPPSSDDPSQAGPHIVTGKLLPGCYLVQVCNLGKTTSMQPYHLRMVYQQ